MKRFTLLLVALVTLSLAYGQKIRFDSDNAAPFSSEHTKMIPPPKETNLKAEGDIIFLETFDWADASNPKGWTLPAGWQIVDMDDLGHNWTWRAGKDSIKGMYTFEPGHAYSKTPDDGFFVLPMDEYNYIDNVYTTLGGTAWFQLPSINCSNRPGVILTLRQFFRCNPAPDLKIQISVDQGVHWALYNLSYATKTNVFCNNPYPEVNISDVAAGMPDVWIRFLWNGMSRYFWCIDDIQLTESYKNDLVLEDSWQYSVDLTAEDENESFVSRIPLSQLGTNNFGGYTFRAAVLNTGINDQEGCKLNAEVFKNGVSVYNQSSEARDIWSSQRDTFPVTNTFVPDGYGDYEMVLSAKQDQTDGRPSNNVYTDTYYITDSVYSICDWDWEEHTSTAGHGNNDGDWMGAVYDINKACEVNSISCAIMVRSKNPRASTQVGYGFQYWLFHYDATEDAWVDVISSDYTEVTQPMLNSWVTLALSKDGESEFLTPGYYIAAIQVYHNGGAGASNNTFRFTIGADQNHQFSDGKTVYRLYNSESWTGLEEMAMVSLNMKAAGAPTTSDVAFNVDMTLPIANGYFKPASGDFIDVAGTFNNWSGSAHFTDANADGIYSLTIPGQSLFNKIEYKYRINGNWNTSEFPSGGPNRNYRVTYYNMLDDIYNNGVSMGVDVNSLNSSINVFPNPSEGMITLKINSTTASDVTVSVVNLQGQVVFEKQYPAVLDLNETIDLRNYAKGMYFLKANNQVVKLVVK